VAKISRAAFSHEVRYSFHCPGCGYGHAFRVQGQSPIWDWNGSVDKPTFHPSLLYLPTPGGTIKRCHLYVCDGMIQYLDDCDHALAGKTVAMEDDA
jgi:hypothetical protein